MLGEKGERRIFFAGGGTAGHLMPAINIAREIVRLNGEIKPLFFGKKKGMERGIVRGFGFDICEIDIVGMRRSISGIIKFVIKWFGGYKQARRIFEEISPLAVIGTGGYVSAPVVKAAFKKKIPVFLQEQNSLPGLASRTLSRYAQLIFTAYESAGEYLDRGKCALVGNPVRTDINSANKEDSCKRFGLDPRKKTLLILGGSSGARGINLAVSALISEKCIPDDWQVLWQTGESDFNNMNSAIPSGDRSVRIVDFIKDMPGAYAVSDLVLSRAGAMAISEITAAGLPSVLIPFPHATGDHQTLNAKVLVDSEAAIIIQEREIKEKLKDIIRSLVNEPEKRKKMSENARKLGKPDAARVIAKTILEKINEI